MHDFIILDCLFPSGAAPPPAGKTNRAGQQPTMPDMFARGQPYAMSSPRFVQITKAMAEFVVVDMKPISTVEGKGFKHLLRTLDPRYKPVSRNTLLDRNIIPLYQETKARIINDMSRAVRHAFTTDCWTSAATEGYITYTAHYIEPESFELKSVVLETRNFKESHTAEHLKGDLLTTSSRWLLKDPVGVRDNAKNIEKAMDLAEIPHLGCCAHILNLAVSRCLKVSEVASLTGKCRKIVAAFKQSEQKTMALKNAEAALEIQVGNNFLTWLFFLDSFHN